MPAAASAQQATTEVAANTIKTPVQESSPTADASVETPCVLKEKVIWCSMCEEVFHRAEDFRRHMDAHRSSKVRKYACRFCPNRYASSAALTGHARRMHSTGGAKLMTAIMKKQKCFKGVNLSKLGHM
ncbi:hypothetical protein AAVH_23400 [Aphelenchoides avenae]|nr:hypothetical protein AAVH_23400 [Aphelenchus avenae]